MTGYPAISELVPHEAPMRALDELIGFSEGCARARLQVNDRSYFAHDGSIDTIVALEYMAQTVAACLGQEAYAAGAAVRVGMVIACREMKIERPRLRCGEVLEIESRRVRGNDSLSHFDAEVWDQSGAVVATSTLTLVHGEKPPD